MKVSILGTGNIGGNLGKKWLEKEHDVLFGVRDNTSENVKKLNINDSRITSIEDAIKQSSIIVLATPFEAVEEIIKNNVLDNKIIIDTTNCISSPLPDGFQSAAEAIAAWSKSGEVVKAFNTTGVANLIDPIYNDSTIDTYICSDNLEAKITVTELAKDIGFDVIDAGGLENASLLENLAKFWIKLAYKEGMGKDIAFKLLKR